MICLIKTFRKCVQTAAEQKNEEDANVYTKSLAFSNICSVYGLGGVHFGS